MAGKDKAQKNEKMSYRDRRQQTYRIIFIAVSVIIILSWVLSLIVNI